MASAWGSSWGSAWGSSWGATSSTPVVTPVQDKIWPWVGENRRDRRRRLEDEEFERLLREQAGELVAEAVEEGRTAALLAHRKSLRELLLTAPILDEPRPPEVSKSDAMKMLADIQRDIVLSLKRIEEDEEEAVILLLQ